MEGRSHALSGVVTGLALAPVLGYEHLVTASPLTQIVTGAAMVPDLDCGSSAASWQIGVAVAVGCAVHDLGDSITLAGCPMLWLLWPFPIKGETWYEIKPLGPLSFRTGGSVEHCQIGRAHV